MGINSFVSVCEEQHKTNMMPCRETGRQIYIGVWIVDVLSLVFSSPLLLHDRLTFGGEASATQTNIFSFFVALSSLAVLAVGITPGLSGGGRKVSALVAAWIELIVLEGAMD